MSDLVANPEDRFSHNEAHMTNRVSSSFPEGDQSVTLTELLDFDTLKW